MSYSLIFLFVEGNDDERFFTKILIPLLKPQNCVRIWKYSKKTIKKRIQFITSIKSMNANYYYISDINNAPCVTHRRRKIEKQFKNKIDLQKIFIVKTEIESWYISGHTAKELKKIGIKKRISNYHMSKEEFNSLIPKKKTRIEFQLDLLEDFNIDLAKRNNTSFSYFLDHWLEIDDGRE